MMRHDRKRFPSYIALCEEAGVGHISDAEMHGDVFGKIDELRLLLGRCATTRKKVIRVARMYLASDVVSLNIVIDKQKYLIVVSDKGYEVWKSNEKTSQIEKHLVHYKNIEDGSFLDLFKKD